MRAGHVAVGVVAAVALAAASVLALPWAATYDPWSWIVWGREIVRGDLSTVAGPSWKPLPVLFTAPFSLTGDLAPALWLVVARAGGLAAIAAAYLAARRLAGPVAGVIAALALTLNLEFHRTVWLGNSEGLLVAALLFAVERHLAGAHRAAFAAGVVAALLRPEVWPFLFLFAMWLAWRDPSARRLVVASGSAVLLVWLVPEYWGSGELLRAAERAQQPVADAATFAPSPALEVAERAERMLFGPTQALVLMAVAFACVRVRTWSARLTLALALLAAAWLAVVAVMTLEGFSGNARYVIAPVALLCVVAGVGAGIATDVLARLMRRAGAAAAGAAALSAALIAAGVVPFAVGHAQELGKRTAVLEYQARLRQNAHVAVDRLGGRAGVRACGPIVTEDYSVPMLAWMLDVHLSDIALVPATSGVVLQARSGPDSPLDPPMPRASAGEIAFYAGPWRVFTGCE